MGVWNRSDKYSYERNTRLLLVCFYVPPETNSNHTSCLKASIRHPFHWWLQCAWRPNRKKRKWSERQVRACDKVTCKTYGHVHISQTRRHTSTTLSTRRLWTFSSRQKTWHHNFKRGKFLTISKVTTDESSATSRLHFRIAFSRGLLPVLFVGCQAVARRL